ncbi:hypothetical protein QSJ18_18310 [Gordonia sp. ABSL1-1]|uniref:hypothetical protein n=1 Tax=Gordonia sp. ABSL1-1 TaxID=3053923 RepID=UPI0025728BE7|nr:hypothetical protein [Gordonia sp. ABSL1-1]MDL9938704.1 hypothetical protein [Gordonia sp. ABSL1-1]
MTNEAAIAETHVAHEWYPRCANCHAQINAWGRICADCRLGRVKAVSDDEEGKA